VNENKISYDDWCKRYYDNTTGKPCTIVSKEDLQELYELAHYSISVNYPENDKWKIEFLKKIKKKYGVSG